METQTLDLIFNTACDFYDDLEISHKGNNITSYIIRINDLNNEYEFFDDVGISVSLNHNLEYNFYYLECCHIKHQIDFIKFEKYKKYFIDRYFDISNNNTDKNLIEKVYIKLKDKRDKQRMSILSEIIDVDIENVNNANELIHQMLQESLRERIIIR